MRRTLAFTLLSLSLLHLGNFASAQDADERKAAKLKRIDHMEKILVQQEDRMRRKMTELSNIVESLGIGDAATMNLAQQSALQYHGQLRIEMSKVRRDLMKAEWMLKAKKEASPESPKATTDSSETKDQKLPPTKPGVTVAATDHDPLTSLRAKDANSEVVKSFSDDPVIAALTRDVEHYRSQLAQSERLLAERVKHLAKSGDKSTATLVSEIEFLTQQENVIRAEMREIEVESRKFGKTSIDVEMKRKEIEALEPVLRKLAQDLESEKVGLRELLQ
jgi:succinoglycan biosynthesis transport protein ExoP